MTGLGRRRLVAVVLSLTTALAACGNDDPTGGAKNVGEAPTESTTATGRQTGMRIAVGDTEALEWGDGDYGVVLVHGAAFDAASWEAQAKRIGAAGTTTLALEDIGPDDIAGAVAYLREDRGIQDVALIGGSVGADAILGLSAEQPDLADQLILLSPNRVVEGLGDQPKLFIASEDESVADVSRTLAESSPGEENVVDILPGAAHAQNIFDSDAGEATLQSILERVARFASS